MKMVMKETVFALSVLIFVFAILLTIAVIAIAIFFQKLRKRIEEEIKAEKTKGNEIVAKMTVKPRKKENKYSKSKKKRDDREPKFYESPPMREEHRELLKMKTLQSWEEACLSRDQVTQLHAGEVFRRSNTLEKEDPYIQCFAGDENPQKLTTFQSANASSSREPVTEAPRKCKSQASTLPRTLEGDDVDSKCISRVKPSHGATLPTHTSFPIKKGHGHGLKGAFRDNVTQKQVSRNVNFTSIKDHDGEMYEVMGNNTVYETNSGFDSNEDFYENKEVIEQENKRRSQTNMAQFPHQNRNLDSQAARHHEKNNEEEVYENQEIVDQYRGKTPQRDDTHQFELYENYVAEETYENC